MERLNVKHTPGLWKVIEFGGELAIAGNDMPPFIQNLGHPESERAKYDAHLMASAPGLLNVCSEILAVLNEGIEDDPKALEWMKGILIGVIAKAEGRA